MSQTTQKFGAIPGLISRIAPFLLPAIFFQSAIFALLSPLPLFLLTLKHRRPWFSLLALISNTAIIYPQSNHTELFLALFLWLIIGFFFPALIRTRLQVKGAYLCALTVALLILTLTLFKLSHDIGMPMPEYLKAQISIGIDHLAAIPESPVKKLIEEQGKSVLLHQLMTEIPSGIIISIMATLWLNLLIASQTTKGFLSQTFWSFYKNPEWLVWPTLISGAIYAFAEHAPYYLGLNCFKVLLVFYAFQGLSVISQILNFFKIKGFTRGILFALTVLVAMPMVLSLGFFDLWFDFRKKFVQS